MNFRWIVVVVLLGATCLLTGFKGLLYDSMPDSRPSLLEPLVKHPDKIARIITGFREVAQQSMPAQQQQIYVLIAAYRKHLVALKANADQGK